MIKINYRLYLARLFIGAFTAWIYVLMRESINIFSMNILYSVLLATSILFIGLVIGGLLSRALDERFWRYSTSQIAFFYIFIVILS